MPVAMREAQAQDWLTDLREFDPVVVAAACTRWRRRPGGRRPTPGDIRAACIEEQREYGTGLPRLPAPGHRERFAEQKARRDEKMLREARIDLDRFARSRGHAGFEDYLAAGGSHAEAAKEMMGVAPAVRGFATAGAALRKYDPGQETLRRARIELGLEIADEPAE